MTTIRKIGVLTSGGDAPGMNAAIRAITRTAIYKGWEVMGVIDGYQGLMDNRLRPLGVRDVGGILGVGGTMLGSARAPEFKTEAGQSRALRHLRQHDIDAMVVIGGNGSQQGTNALHKLGFPAVGVASTIDNDLVGSDITIGVDTAMNIALEALDRLRTTASSHKRAFIIEVMGRDCGYLGLMVGIAGGAECIQIPEDEYPPEKVTQVLVNAYQRGKKHGIIVVAEGCDNKADALAQYIKEHTHMGFPIRVTKLGHVQRGGNPTISDRILATRLGAHATDCLARGEYGVVTGITNNQLSTTPLEEVVTQKKPLDLSLLALAHQLDQ